MALVHDAGTGLWALGPAALGDRTLATAQAPELALPDFDGNELRLSSLRGQKVVLVAWAPYCGCRMDLPGWQALRAELHPLGLEVVTVCLEMNGPEPGRRYVEAARPEHPSVVDETHQMDALFGVVNIPNVVWIDEEGVIVRPAEPGWPPDAEPTEAELAGFAAAVAARQGRDEPTTHPRDVLMGGQDRRVYPDRLRDWVRNGRASRYALTPEQVVARSRPRPIEVSEAAAEFELANHLWRSGRHDAAIPHFQASHRLQPDNWTYKRQAWSAVGAERSGTVDVQGPSATDTEPWPFESDFMGDFSTVAAGEYYPDTYGRS